MKGKPVRYLPLIALLLATPAAAKDVTITLNDQEQQAWAQLLDQAVRAGGLQSAPNALRLYMKLQEALKAAQPVAPKPAEAPKKP
jgi:hypothetical protein